MLEVKAKQDPQQSKAPTPWALRVIPMPAYGPNWAPSVSFIIAATVPAALILALFHYQYWITTVLLLIPALPYYLFILFYYFNNNSKRRSELRTFQNQKHEYERALTFISRLGERNTVLLGVDSKSIQTSVQRGWGHPPSQLSHGAWGQYFADFREASSHYLKLYQELLAADVYIRTAANDPTNDDGANATDSPPANLRGYGPAFQVVSLRSEMSQSIASCYTYTWLIGAGARETMFRSQVNTSSFAHKVISQIDKCGITGKRQVMAEFTDDGTWSLGETYVAISKLKECIAEVQTLTAHLAELAESKKLADTQRKDSSLPSEKHENRDAKTHPRADAAGCTSKEPTALQQSGQSKPEIGTPKPNRASSLDDVEERLQKIAKSVALPPAVWTSLERSLRAYLLRDPASPRGIVLHGPPGTGKTTIAKSIATHAGCTFVSLSAPDLKQQFIGASGQKVKEIWDHAAGKPTIIFIDECDAIFQKRGGLDSDKFTDEIVAAILPRMDGMAPGGNILVIGATNRFDAMDQAIVSRFDLAVPVPLPDAAARTRILAGAFKTYLFTGQPPQNLVDASDGLSGRELEAMVRSARQDVLAGETADQVFARATAAWRARSSSTINRNLSWEDVVVSDATRTTLQRYATMLPRREELKRLGLDVLPKGVLLTGPPGTGKTQLARVLAATAQVGFVATSTADLKAGFLGQSGQRVKEVFSRARSMSPCILFIDELDIVAPARGSGDALTQEIVGQFLQELDGVVAQDAHLFLMAASNVPDAIDPAVLSRFSERIEIPLPDLQQRERIVLALLRGRPIQGEACALAAALAAATPGASGRDLKNRIDNGLRMVAERALRNGGLADGLCAADVLV